MKSINKAEILTPDNGHLLFQSSPFTTFCHPNRRWMDYCSFFLTSTKWNSRKRAKLRSQL